MTNLIIDDSGIPFNEIFNDQHVLPYLKQDETEITFIELLIRTSLGEHWEILRTINLN